jgi:hypothetical protein
MRKSTVTWTWLSGLVAIVLGLVATGVGIGLIFGAGGTYGGPSGNDFTPTLDAFFWGMVALASTGAFVALAGAVLQLVAWIGAMVNTFALADKAWFVVLLIGGLLGFAGLLFAPLAVMVGYLIAGPDGTRPAAQSTLPLAPGGAIPAAT